MAKYEFELNDDQLEGLKKLGIVPIEYEPDDNSFPKMNDEYYSLSGYAEVIKNVYDDDFADRGKLSIGNVFKTKEEAEFELERLKVITEMRKIASNNFKLSHYRYFIYYDRADNTVGITYECAYNTNPLVQFASREAAEKCIESVGEERIKKYYLKIEEG